MSTEHEIIKEELVEEIEHEVAEELHADEKLPPPAPMGGPIADWLRSPALAPIVNHPFIDTMERFTEGAAKRFRVKPGTLVILSVVLIGILLSLLLPVTTLHVSLAPEAIHPDGGWLTNSLIHMIVVDLILVGIIYMVTGFKDKLSFVPTGAQNLFEMVFGYLYDLCESVAGQNARRFAPWCLTVFFFILVSNWSGLIPGVGTIGVWHESHYGAEDKAHGDEGDHGEGDHGEGDHGEEGDDSQGLLNGSETLADSAPSNRIAMSDGRIVFVTPSSVEPSPASAGEGGKTLIPIFRPPTASLNFTFALAIMTMIIVQYYGFKKLGRSYLQKFFTLRGEGAMKGINAFVGILELISEFSRILSFAFRLFGNIFAGEVMLATMLFLVTFMLPIPFYFLEFFVGFVQALVFMMLALIFFTLAEHAHGDEHH